MDSIRLDKFHWNHPSDSSLFRDHLLQACLRSQARVHQSLVNLYPLVPRANRSTSSFPSSRDRLCYSFEDGL